MKPSVGFAFCLALLGCQSALADRPYTIVLLSYNAEAAAQALSVANTIRATYPFSMLKEQLEFKFVLGDHAKMNCHHPYKDIERVMTCDNEYAGTVGGNLGADKVMNLVKAGNSGGGGSVPTISVDGYESIRTHELAHSIAGMADEYTYDKDEANFYCKPPSNSPNMAHFAPKLASFPNDVTARSIHGGDIPWFGSIKATIPIVNGTELGTPGSSFPFHIGRNNHETGLYRGGECDLVIPSWHSYAGDNIMNSVPLWPSSPLGKFNPVQSKALLRAMEKARGARFTGIDEPASPDSAAPKAKDVGSGTSTPAGVQPAN